jgi:hypothetical protein
MLIDHIGLIFFPDLVILRIIGRLSMPLFAYCIARGFLSSNKHGTAEAYIKRMAVFAAVSQIPYMLMVKAICGNIGVTWLICLLILYLTEKQDKSKKDYFLIFSLAVLSAIAPIDYGVYGIGFTVIFYFFYVERYDWNKFFAGFIILHVFALTQTLSFGLFQIFTLPCILGLELLKKYDGKIKINRKFFYSFYPLHMLFFVLIKAFML